VFVTNKDLLVHARQRASKINIDADLRLASTATLREVLAKLPKEFDQRKISGTAKEAMKEVIKGKMQFFGSSSQSLSGE
jgi:fructose-bisphosphate aldolase class II